MSGRLSKVKLLIFSLFIPTVVSFQLASLRLSPYRIVLLLTFITAVTAVIGGRCLGKDKSDFYIFLYAIWCVLSFKVNHDMSIAIESGGVWILESLGPYCLVRYSLITLESIESVIKLLLKCITLMMLITVPESLFGFNWALKLIYPIMGHGNFVNIGERSGFTRAFGVFDHAIINGVISSSLYGVAWFFVVKGKAKKTLLIILAALTSMSSGAVASLMTQSMIIVWEISTRNMKKRWAKLAFLIFLGYLAIDLISNRSGIKVIISYLTFSPATAYWRIVIWDNGIENVYANPFFGLGLNDWVRPSWMHSGSMDNFWLVIMVRHGFVGFGFLVLCIWKIAKGLMYLKTAEKRINLMRRAWLTGLAGLIISACTVHFWNQAYIYFMFYLGLGAALLKVSENHESIRQRETDDKINYHSSKLEYTKNDR